MNVRKRAARFGPRVRWSQMSYYIDEPDLKSWHRMGPRRQSAHKIMARRTIRSWRRLGLVIPGPPSQGTRSHP